MHTYGELFARIYNLRWASFAREYAPVIRAHYERIAGSDAPKSLLDIGCGAGHLAQHFLEQGYQVVGLDLSPDMLRHAHDNNQSYVDSGQAGFILADAARFALDRRFGLAVSTFDMLNHLPDEAVLQSCFESAYAALGEDGVLVFDLNTRKGLLENWNHVAVTDTEELMLINRGIYDGGERAHVRITGFVRRQDGLYERFSEVMHNTAFDIERVRAMLGTVGFRDLTFADGSDLAAAINDPESLKRVWVTARK